jgi:putative ABC transport system substrate-binding protein
VKRRDFIAGLAGIAAARQFAARAQPMDRIRRVGVLMNGPSDAPLTRNALAAFIESLRGRGWTEPRNLHLDLRWSGADISGFEQAALELLALEPDALLASSSPAVQALHKQTKNIPIVFTNVTDPVGQGFVKTLSRPDGNVTGFLNYDAPMAGKWLGLLKEIVPNLSRAALLFNPDTAPFAPLLKQALEASAPSLAVTVEMAPFHSTDDIDRIVGTLGLTAGSGLIVAPETSTGIHRMQIIDLTAQHRVPAIYAYRYLAELGGLATYGIVASDLFRRAGLYIDQILRGAMPSELPVQTPSEFELVINLKTARALDLTVPQSLLHLADEVIE